jgi:hypothetical protein
MSSDLLHVRQPGQRMAHRGLAEAEPAAGTRHVAFLHDGIEDDEQIEVDCSQFDGGLSQDRSLRSLFTPDMYL